MNQANNEGAAVSEPSGATSQDVIDAALQSFDGHTIDLREALDRVRWFCQEHRRISNDPLVQAVATVVERKLAEAISLVGSMAKCHHMALVQTKKQDDAVRAAAGDMRACCATARSTLINRENVSEDIELTGVANALAHVIAAYDDAVKQ